MEVRELMTLKVLITALALTNYTHLHALNLSHELKCGHIVHFLFMLRAKKVEE